MLVDCYFRINAADCNGINMGNLAGKEFDYVPYPDRPSDSISYSICGHISKGCGNQEWGNICHQPGCCGVCQSWLQTDGYHYYACLGKDLQFVTLKISGVCSKSLILHYINGDVLYRDSRFTREVTVTLNCGPSDFKTTYFYAPTPSSPPPYKYNITAESNVICDLSGDFSIGGLLLSIDKLVS